MLTSYAPIYVHPFFSHLPPLPAFNAPKHVSASGIFAATFGARLDSTTQSASTHGAVA